MKGSDHIDERLDADAVPSYAVGSVPLVGETGTVIFAGREEYWLSACRTFVDRNGFAKHVDTVLNEKGDLSSLSNLSADVIVSALSLHVLTLEDCRQAFSILRPGGRLSVAERSPENWARELVKRLAQAGFENISLQSDETGKPSAFIWRYVTGREA